MGQVVFAPIPGDVTGFLGGYLFGAWGGAFLSTMGLTIGSMLIFFIGHFLGKRVVRRMVSCETYEKYNESVQYKSMMRDPFYRWMARQGKERACETVSNCEVRPDSLPSNMAN